MKHQALFSSKDKSKKVKVSSAAIFVWRFKGLILTSAKSCVSLNAEFSNPRFLPGEVERINPKSMCMIWPCESSRMLPLCLKQKEKYN